LSLAGSVKLYIKPFTAITLWGISFVATKIVLDELSPLQLIFSRLLLGIIFLTSIIIVRKEGLTIDKRSGLFIFILSLVGVVHLAIQVTGMQFTSASNTGWIIGITPVFMSLLGIYFFKEKLSVINVAGIVIATGGLLLLISGGNLMNIDLIRNKGDFLVLGSALTWSIYSIINKKITFNYSPLLTMFYLFLFMIIIVSFFVVGESYFNAIVNLKITTSGWLIFLGVFSSGLAYLLWAESLKEMKSSSAGAFIYIEPFITVITAALLLQEPITTVIIISGVIITLGVILVNRKN
jgi:drug/metabolite transporter (DMT)-like permease